MGKRQAVLESFQGDISPIQRGSTPLFNERIKVNMKTGLERIREKAKVDKHLKFSSLAHHINSNKIKEAVKAIPKRTAIGVDGLDYQATIQNFDHWSSKFIRDLHNKGYAPPPVKRVYIPKPGKKAMRPIGIPCIADRACQKAVSDVLSAVYEEDFCDTSFGGRKGIGAHHALATLEEILYRRKVGWVIEADLKNFFGSLSHSWIIKFFRHRISDPRIISLLRRWLKAGVMENDRIEETSIGTPQGGPVSVLVSNVCLHYVLDLWFEKVVKPRMRGEVYLVRYLDDFVICCQYRGDARKIFEAMQRRLTKFGLELESSKTELIEFGRFAKQNSIRYNRKLKPIYFLGFTIVGSFNHKGNYCIRFKTEKSRYRRALAKIKEQLRKNRHRPLREQSTSLNRLLSGLYNYYGVSSNANFLRKLYYFSEKYWRKVLSSRSQKGKLNWEKYRKIKGYFPIEKPRVYHSYVKLGEMAIL